MIEIGERSAARQVEPLRVRTGVEEGVVYVHELLYHLLLLCDLCGKLQTITGSDNDSPRGRRFIIHLRYLSRSSQLSIIHSAFTSSYLTFLPIIR